MRKILAGALLVVSTFSVPAFADSEPQWFNYTLTGGTITGTIDGVAFSNANWSITTTADAAMVSSPGSWSPLNLLAAVPTLTIDDGSHTYTMTLLGSGSQYWALVSRDYSSFSDGPFGMVGFSLFEDGDFNGLKAVYIDGTSNFNSLTAALELATNSGFDTGTYQTNMGDLVVSSEVHMNGTFSASAIPEPSTYAALLGAAGLGVALLRRRRRI